MLLLMCICALVYSDQLQMMRSEVMRPLEDIQARQRRDYEAYFDGRSVYLEFRFSLINVFQLEVLELGRNSTRQVGTNHHDRKLAFPPSTPASKKKHNMTHLLCSSPLISYKARTVRRLHTCGNHLSHSKISTSQEYFQMHSNRPMLIRFSMLYARYAVAYSLRYICICSSIPPLQNNCDIFLPPLLYTSNTISLPVESDISAVPFLSHNQFPGRKTLHLFLASKKTSLDHVQISLYAINQDECPSPYPNQSYSTKP